MTAVLVFAAQVGLPEAGAVESDSQSGKDLGPPASVSEISSLDSPYIPVDSWIYPAVLLYFTRAANPSMPGKQPAIPFPWLRLFGAGGVPFINPATGLPFSQTTIPLSPIGTATNGRVLEAYASYLLANHELSFGKHEEWLGPGMGASMAYSNNAENIYSFQINRVGPSHIPAFPGWSDPSAINFWLAHSKTMWIPTIPGFTLKSWPSGQQKV